MLFQSSLEFYKVIVFFFWTKSLDHWPENNETVSPSQPCTCEALLPDAIFPMGELELLEKSSVQISHKLELEISKV